MQVMKLVFYSHKNWSKCVHTFLYIKIAHRRHAIFKDEFAVILSNYLVHGSQDLLCCCSLIRI